MKMICKVLQILSTEIISDKLKKQSIIVEYLVNKYKQTLVIDFFNRNIYILENVEIWNMLELEIYFKYFQSKKWNYINTISCYKKYSNTLDMR